MINTMRIMLSNVSVSRFPCRSAWRWAVLLAALLVGAANAQIAVGILDTKADGSAYLYTQRKLEPQTIVTLDASIEKKCCWTGKGSDFRLLSASEIQAARKKRPSGNVDMQSGMLVYELRNPGYGWRENISIAVIDSDQLVRLNHTRKVIQKLGVMKAGEKYLVTLYPGMEGINLTLHQGRKKIDHLYYYASQ